ncbi:tetratricopeptide (TPR) repeat protein, partial [Methanococcus voltae]
MDINNEIDGKNKNFGRPENEKKSEDTQNFEKNFDMGIKNFQFKNYKSALSAFSTAIKLSKEEDISKEKYYKVYLNRGIAYLIMEDNTNALNDFNRAVELSKEEDYRVYLNRGIAYLI